MDAQGRLASLWTQFTRIERPHCVEHAHSADYPPLLKQLRDLSIKVSRVAVTQQGDIDSRDSLLRHIAAEEAKLQSRVPQFTVEGLCS